MSPGNGGMRRLREVPEQRYHNPQLSKIPYHNAMILCVFVHMMDTERMMVFSPRQVEQTEAEEATRKSSRPRDMSPAADPQQGEPIAASADPGV